jgi:hypothetical protein
MIGCFFVCLGVFIALVICIVLAKKDQAAFEARFPPLTDAEFVARCGPGVSPAVALRIRRVLADALNIEYERIHPSSRIVQDLGAE